MSSDFASRKPVTTLDAAISLRDDELGSRAIWCADPALRADNPAVESEWNLLTSAELRGRLSAVLSRMETSSRLAVINARSDLRKAQRAILDASPSGAVPTDSREWLEAELEASERISGTERFAAKLRRAVREADMVHEARSYGVASAALLLVDAARKYLSDDTMPDVELAEAADAVESAVIDASGRGVA